MSGIDLMRFTSEEFGLVRAVELDGKTWLVGKDVATALGCKDSVNALKSHVDDEDKKGWQITTLSRGDRNTTIINESGVYSFNRFYVYTVRKFKIFDVFRTHSGGNLFQFLRGES